MILFLKMEKRDPDKNEVIHQLYTSKAKNKSIIDQSESNKINRRDTCGEIIVCVYINTQELIGEINSRRPRGRSRQTWIDTLKTDLIKVAPGMELEESENISRDGEK